MEETTYVNSNRRPACQHKRLAEGALLAATWAHLYRLQSSWPGQPTTG